MIFERQNKNRGINFDIIETTVPIEATCTVNETRITLKGNFSIEKMDGSQRWGKQVQFVCYGKDIKVEARPKHTTGYNRIEIYLPVFEAKEMMKKFLRKLECQSKLSNR